MRNKSIKMYKKKNGDKNYMFKAYLGLDPVTGKRIETTRRGFKSAKEAQRALDRLKVDYDKNGWKKDSKLNIKTVNDLFEIWIDYKKSVLKPTTLAGYQFSYNKHIKPNLGSIKLAKLTPFILQNFFDDLSEKYTNVKSYRNIVQQMLSYAVRMEIISENVMGRIEVKKGKAPEHEVETNFYDKTQLAYFLEIVKDNFSLKYYAYFRLLAYTGIRRGESLGLTWADLDITNKCISINKNVVYDSSKNKTIIIAPKTKSSIRKISLDKKTIIVLQQWHLEQTKWKMMKGLRTDNAEQLIFSNHKNKALNPGLPSSWLRIIYKKFPQKKIRIHGFRHTHASLLFEAGASIKEVQERLGHSDSNLTLQIYTHVVKSRKSETGTKFAKYMNN